MEYKFNFRGSIVKYLATESLKCPLLRGNRNCRAHHCDRSRGILVLLTEAVSKTSSVLS